MDSRRIEELAADWLARRDSGEWTPEDQRARDEWLAQSFEHRVAYLRLEAVWERAGRLKAFRAGTDHVGTVPAPGAWRETPFFTGKSRATGETHAVEESGPSRPRPANRKFLAVAASALVVAFAAIWLYSAGLDKDRYRTPVGGTASIPLTDGSKVTLNTASEIGVRLTASERRVELARGEAFFDVARDPTRPFVVEAGNTRVVAVGTRFSVRRDESDDIRVTVTEGSVRVEKRNEPAHKEPLAAGSMARTSGDTILVQKGSAEAAENALSWRSGYLVFDDTALADAIAEFNRYSRQQMRVGDARTAAIRISGKFRYDSSEIFLRLLRDGYSIRVVPSGDDVVLTGAN